MIPIALLLGVLVIAVSKPKGLPEFLVAVPAALLVVVLGFESTAQAWDRVHDLISVVGFLAAILVVSDACARLGLFDAMGSKLAELAGNRPKRLLGLVFGLGAAVTVVLSLDATVVLLTPVVVRAALQRKIDPTPTTYACGHLANSASLLLPVSNLTNLLAFSATGLTFLEFTGRMAGPFVVSLLVEYCVFRLWFRRSLKVSSEAARRPSVAVPLFPAVVVGLMLVGFVAGSFAHVEPVWPACIAALVLSLRGLHRRATTPKFVLRSASVGFCLFVLALGVVVDAVASNGLGEHLAGIIPDGGGYWQLLLVAVIAAGLSNLVNNIPAVLLMIPLVDSSPEALLAVLVGVNIGPNLTYVGSLATLLWRSEAKKTGVVVSLGRFTALGVATVVPSLMLCTLALRVTA